MGYEVINKGYNGGMIDPLDVNVFCGVQQDTDCKKNKNCDCGEDFGCNISVNGSCSGGNKDFKCTRDGGCNPCAMPRASRFSQY